MAYVGFCFVCDFIGRMMPISNFKKLKKKKKRNTWVKGLLHREQGLTLKTRIPTNMSVLEPAGTCLYFPCFRVFSSISSISRTRDVHFHRRPFAFSPWLFFVMGYVRHRVQCLWQKLAQVHGGKFRTPDGLLNRTASSCKEDGA